MFPIFSGDSEVRDSILNSGGSKESARVTNSPVLRNTDLESASTTLLYVICIEKIVNTKMFFQDVIPGEVISLSK